MLTCAVPTSLSSTQHWPITINGHTTVKEEPEETCNEYSKDQCNSFFSEGFHSASPSSSSKDSAASPRSVASGGEPSPTLYDAAPIYDTASVHGNNIHLETFHSEYPYNHLAPPDAGFNARFSPGNHGRDTNSIRSATPISPRVISPDRQTIIANKTCRQSPREYKGDNNYDDDSRDDTDDEPGLRVPAVNSHGKVKTFKCKQCEFVAVTKLSFWEHSKEHIKPEKMLKCPKCPFVTEYKHHLEYHMRNHFGSKPFRCSQCDYSCVNKSMLNSHLKSHSNIYQYRCADCNYATKYCHSLKLHLRKYRHNPAMVLNEDGTPNPLPIIDVYGTRRGPKMKHSQHQSDISGPLSPIAGARAPHLEPLFRHPFGMNLPYGGLLPHPFLFPPSENFSRHPEERRSRSPPQTQIQSKQMDMEVESKECVPPIPVVSSPRSSPELIPPDALDLSRREESPARPSSPDRSSPTTPTTAMKNRRKGRAFKLEPEALRMQHSSTPPTAPAALSTSYECPHCEIVFRDLTMHMIHMGFHGYNDPFMCNKCGERTTDRISFFIHLGRAQHA